MVMAMTFLSSSAQQHAVFIHGDNWSAARKDAIESIVVRQPPLIDVYMKGKKVSLLADSTYWNRTIADTLYVTYQEGRVSIRNPRLESIQIDVRGADVYVSATNDIPFVCKATGNSIDGRLIIDSDTTFTLVLAGLNLTSAKGSAICLPQKQKARIELAEGSENTLADAQNYQVDSTDTSNGCLFSRGSLVFTGTGALGVTGNSRHAVSSSKNIVIENGHLIIHNTQKDGIHCDRLKMEGGKVTLHLPTDATKGIKCKEAFAMSGGCIDGEATGNVIIEDGETSYCSLIKSNGTFAMSDGEIAFQHHGQGGRCISVDGNMTTDGGTMNLECHGDGGSYMTSSYTPDYYTPKCITVDDSLCIRGGAVHCFSTGLGGKGIVAGNYLAIGDSLEHNRANAPVIVVSTKGECIINDVDEDKRFGCPKGIKANETLHIFGGTISVSTAGMGGEGIECNGNMYIHGGAIECNTFDDGINVGHSIEISGGEVYCNSVDNDGIDSNGSITISGGIVASVNQNKPNESFDSENGQLYLLGGTVFGIGSGPVDVAEATRPCYTTPYDMTGEDGIRSRGLILTEGKYVCIGDQEGSVMALLNDNKAFRSFITVTSAFFIGKEMLVISEADSISNAHHACFSDKLLFGGKPINPTSVLEIDVQTIE